MKIINKLKTSSTFATWFGQGIIMLGSVIILPVLFSYNSSEEINLWLLFISIFTLKNLGDFGFWSTFVRVIGGANGGVENISEISKFIKGEKPPNIHLINKIIVIQDRVYFYLSLLTLGILLLTFPLFIKPINDAGLGIEGWLAWGIVIICSAIDIWSRKYQNLLLGFNKVPLVRYTIGFLGIGSIISMLVSIFIIHSILYLVMAHQIWVIVRLVIFWRMEARFVQKKNLKKGNEFDGFVFKEIWGAAWKSGLTSFFSIGFIQLSGLLYAQYGDSNQSVGYLLSIKVLDIIRNFSSSPFYSKLPLLAKLRGNGDKERFMAISINNMKYSYITFIFLFVIATFVGNPILNFLNKDINIFQTMDWGVLGIAYYLHRYSAMHTHLYSTSNLVNSHINESVTGIIYLGVSLIILNLLEINGFSWGLLFGIGGFSVWYAGYYSYSLLKVDVLTFEKKTYFFMLLTVLIIFATVKYNW